MVVNLPNNILRQTDVRETITNTAEGSINYNFGYAQFIYTMTTTTMNYCTFSQDGTNLYITKTDGKIYQYALSKRWDLSTASAVTNIASGDTAPNGICFSPNGLKMYVAGNNSNVIKEYTLSTAWDLDTAAFVQNFSVAADDIIPTSLYIRGDGKQIYMAGRTNSKVYTYNLSTPWDISTAVLIDYFAVTSIISHTMSANGLYMFVSISSQVNKYVLSTPFKVSSAVLDSTFSLPLGSAINNITFRPNGRKMYIGHTAGVLYLNEYTIKRGWK